MPNRPGVLARTCSTISESNVNIMAMAVHDTVDQAVVRLLVDHPTKALLLLEQEEFYVLEQEVVVIEIQNAAGEITRIAQCLAQADINIHYLYCTATPKQEYGCLVIKTDNPERTDEILTR